MYKCRKKNKYVNDRNESKPHILICSFPSFCQKIKSEYGTKGVNGEQHNDVDAIAIDEGGDLENFPAASNSNND